MPELARSTAARYALDAPVGTSLAEALRDELGFTGTKVACDEGHCGACTVLVDGAPVLSCITLAHRVDGREVTTIEGLRDHPLVDAFVRADAVQCGFCTPGQIVSAPSRSSSDRPSPTRRGDPPPHGRQHLPLRHLSEDRGGDPHVARLIRTEKEVEGRFEEVWLVVEEDPLEQWPAGPARRSSAGRRRAPTGSRAPAARRSSRPTSQLPGMLHTAVLRSPASRARACDAHRPRAPRSRRPACAARSGPDDMPRRSPTSAATRARAVAAVCADTLAQAQRGASR